MPVSLKPAINFSPVSLTPLNSLNIHSRIYPRISKKFKTAPMEYLGAWGTLIHEKKLKSKISCQTPFKLKVPYNIYLRLRDLKIEICDVRRFFCRLL